jgi:hypothetical protein
LLSPFFAEIAYLDLEIKCTDASPVTVKSIGGEAELFTTGCFVREWIMRIEGRERSRGEDGH